MSFKAASSKHNTSVGPAVENLCSRAVNLTNNIDTHLSDHVETQEVPNELYRSFIAKFYRLRETLWQIQAGLSRLTDGDNLIPYETSQTLATKLQLTIRDLVSCDLLVVKLISGSRKTGFGKFVQNFKQASIDTDISNLGDALGRHRESLRTGWISVNDTFNKIDQARLTERTGNDLSSNPNEDSGAFKISLRPYPSVRIERTADTRTQISSHQVPRNYAVVNSGFSPRRQSQDQLSRTDLRQSPSSKSSQHSGPHTPRPGEQEWMNPIIWSGDQTEGRDSFSRTSSRRNDPVKMPTKALPKALTQQSTETNSGATSHKAALASALQRRDHRTLQQLLRGMSNDEAVSTGLLTQAVGSNDISSTRLLLTHGVPVNGVDDDRNSPLLVAVATWSFDIASLLLEHGADPNLSPENSELSPFLLAARQNQVEVVQLMLEHGANVNLQMPNGDTPIVACIGYGARRELVELLLTSGGSPNQKTRDGRTPLVEALIIKRVDLVKLLLSHGANPNLAGPKHPLWPATYLPEALKLLIEKGAMTKMASGNMELAASINSIESVNILLDAGVSPNLKKDMVYTPLCTAIRDDRDDIVALLLGRGADPNLPASEYPAWKCITHNRLHYLPSLLAAGADLRSPPGITELAVAHNSKEALLYLLQNGADVNAANEDGRTALTTAIKEGRTQLLDILLAHDARVTARGEDWPLCMALKDPSLLKRLLEHVSNIKSVTRGIIELAVQVNQLESVKLLVEAGISVEDRTGGVFSPLTSAIRENRKDIVQYLIDVAGADVNAPGEHLPLIKAIRRRLSSDDNEIVEYLLRRGADINLIYRGWNAIMQAIEKGDKRLLHLLVEKGNGIDLEVVDSESGQTVHEMIQDRGWSEDIDLLMQNRNQLRMIADGSDPES